MPSPGMLWRPPHTTPQHFDLEILPRLHGAELRGRAWVLLFLGLAIGVRKWRNFPGHPLLGRRSDHVVYSGLELCVCVAVDGWEAPLRADLFGFHVERLQKQLWVWLDPSFPLHA